MVAVREISWEEMSAPGFADPQRQAFRQAVAQIAAQAASKLPECNGRIESALKLVLASDVTLGADGTATVVGSASDPQKTYAVKPGHCECPDFARAPYGGLCKHRLSAAILRRAQSLLTTGEVVEDVEPECVPTPAPTGNIPPQYIVELHGKSFVLFAGLLTLAHQRGLVSLTATWTYNDTGLSLAHAVATFPFGTFEESGDATPDNVTKKVSPHFRRVALTRAKARALRDALNVDMVSLEELSD